MTFHASHMNTQPDAHQIVHSILTDEKSFYYRFEQDLNHAQHEIIIESPFITIPKIQHLKPLFVHALNRGVEVFVITRHPEEQEEFMQIQSEESICFFEQIGIHVYMWKTHHRKIAMIDRKIVWKGSLNILSHRNSHEFMEREEDEEKAKQLFSFLKYDYILTT